MSVLSIKKNHGWSVPLIRTIPSRGKCPESFEIHLRVYGKNNRREYVVLEPV